METTQSRTAFLHYFPPPLIVVKVHSTGLEWWESQGMPETLTLGCRTLEMRPTWRTYAQPRAGKHFIYRAAPDLTWPTVEYDTYIDTRTYWSTLPPDPTKWWINQRVPVEVDWFPDLTPMRELASRSA